MAKNYRADEYRLADIILASQAIEGILGTITKELFLASELHRSAAQYQLVTIGEAVGQISPTLKTKYPNIPWQDIKDFRNVAVHGYFSTDWNIVWEAAINNVPELAEQILAILENDFPEFLGK